MKTFLFILFLSNTSFGQTKNFNLNDSTFEAGQELNLDLRFSSCRMVIDTLTINPLDSLANFILARPGFTFEFAFNTDCRGDSTSNMRLCEYRAKAVKSWLLSKGVSENQLLMKANGERVPAVLYPENKFVCSLLPEEFRTIDSYQLSEPFVNQFKSDKKLYEYLHAQNRRTVLRIISIGN